MSDSAPPMSAAISFVVISCQAKLHFLTGSQKNIFYQMPAEFFSMNKDSPSRPLAIISNEVQIFPS
jgi:hypothetical protein